MKIAPRLACAMSMIGCGLVMSAPVRAADSSGGVVDGVLFAGVQTSMTAPTNGGSSSYEWRPLVTHDAGRGREGNISKVIDGIRYFLYERIGPDGTDLVWVAQATPRQLALRAAVTVRSKLPRPTVSMAPPSDEGVVNVASWLWIDPTLWVPVSAFAWIPGDSEPMWARTTATPVAMTFTTQDDGTATGTRTGSVTCAGPGTTWNSTVSATASSSCMYRYEHSSVSRPGGTFSAQVEVRFKVSWTSNSGSGGTLPNERTSSTFSVKVDELQALVE